MDETKTGLSDLQRVLATSVKETHQLIISPDYEVYISWVEEAIFNKPKIPLRFALLTSSRSLSIGPWEKAME
jgi:hypothetical protein